MKQTNNCFSTVRHPHTFLVEGKGGNEEGVADYVLTPNFLTGITIYHNLMKSLLNESLFHLTLVEIR